MPSVGTWENVRSGEAPEKQKHVGEGDESSRRKAHAASKGNTRDFHSCVLCHSYHYKQLRRDRYWAARKSWLVFKRSYIKVYRYGAHQYSQALTGTRCCSSYKQENAFNVIFIMLLFKFLFSFMHYVIRITNYAHLFENGMMISVKHKFCLDDFLFASYHNFPFRVFNSHGNF